MIKLFHPSQLSSCFGAGQRKSRDCNELLINYGIWKESRARLARSVQQVALYGAVQSAVSDEASRPATLGGLLALYITPANGQDRDQVGELASAVRHNERRMIV